MFKIPLISHAATASQALPLAALLRYGRALPPARAWILVWAAAVLLSDGSALWFALHGTGNLWIEYAASPLVLGAALMALSCWQANSRVRMLFRFAIPVFILVSVTMVALIEDTDNFSLITGAFESMIVFTASLATLLACAWRLEGSLARQDWFWVGLGLALRYGASAGLDPIARVLVGEDIPTLITVHVVGAWIDLIASLLIAGGLLCPILPLRASSGPSLPASSPWSSSSSRSAPPW